MHRLAHSAGRNGLLALAALGLALGAGAGRPAPAQSDAPPARTIEELREAGAPRVIVRSDRFSETQGYVELEDEDVLVIRALDGTLQSFSKARLLRLVRLVEPLPGQSGTVVLRNGELRDGIVIGETFDHVELEIEGVRTRLKREVVDYVVLEPTFEERYRHFKQALEPEMVGGHMTLCRWLVDERRYEIARRELDDLIRRHDPPEARKLRRLVLAQLALRDARDKPRRDDGPREDRDVPEAPPVPLTRADVNLIRVYEIDFNRPPRVQVDRHTVSEILDRYATNKLIPADPEQRQRLYKADSIDVVKLLFELRARDLYPRIEVLSEPFALNVFRQRVHDTWLMNNCSTSRCHGGPDAGRLFIHRRNYKDPRVRYTNLLTLERLELDPEWPLINYETPTDSLIIQHGLPPQQARKPHPAVRGWEPAFRRLADRAVQQTVTWIEAMLEPRPDYPVEYEPPLPPAPPVEATDPPDTGDGEAGGGRRGR